MAPPTSIVTRDSVARDLSAYFSPRQATLAKLINDKAQSVESVTTAAIAEVLRDDKLWPCTPQSLFDVVLGATALGLRVGKDLGNAYFVPFRDNKTNTTVATMIIGYRGLVTLARRSGEIVSITASIVCENDHFEASEGSDGRLVHKPDYFNRKGRGEMVGVYAYAKLAGGGEQWVVMAKTEVDAIRGRSRASGSGPWVTDYEEMAKKTAVRRLCKMLPISVDAAEAIAADTDREFTQARDVTPSRPTLPTTVSAPATVEAPQQPEAVAAPVQPPQEEQRDPAQVAREQEELRRADAAPAAAARAPRGARRTFFGAQQDVPATATVTLGFEAARIAKMVEGATAAQAGALIETIDASWHDASISPEEAERLKSLVADKTTAKK